MSIGRKGKRGRGSGGAGEGEGGAVLDPRGVTFFKYFVVLKNT